MAEKLLTSDELAEMLQVPVRTLDQWAYLKIGPPFAKVGRYRRYIPSGVKKWLDQQMSGGTA